ncbi:MAG: glycosyltransferase [Selenomonadaceae bacterium]|nr:glycosyltransferase [Selenomonadaceae bacterium]
MIKKAKRFPLVSVIIPMFNSAKFIPQTLESLLYQTMKDFEVIVVDDCSTDNSVEVVESFLDKFGGRLHIIKLKKNTGMPGLPRNAGIRFACGKYIFFLDSDDLYTKTALEELSGLAEEYQADVVRTNSWFVLWNGKKKYEDDPSFYDMSELLNPSNFTTRNELEPSFWSEPKLEPKDTIERINIFLNWDTLWTSWLSFCRRDFLINNQIFFPKMRKSEDAPFVLSCSLFAERYLRVPNAVYISRPRAGSVSREDDRNFDIEKYFHENVLPLKQGLNELEKVMNMLSFFKIYPNYYYAVLDFFCKKMFSWLIPMQSIYEKEPTFELNRFVQKEFHADDALLASHLFDTVNLQILRIKELENRNKTLEETVKKLKNEILGILDTK